MNSIHSIADLLETVNVLYKLLDGTIEIDSDGWPVFCKDHFLSEWPADMITYDNRNSRLIQSKSTTLLCHFAGDKQNYRRFPKLIDDIPKYRDYLAVVFPDITVTKDMDIEMQELILLSNHLYAAVLAVNGIKLAFNTRTGSSETLTSFRHIPRGIVCASSFLGCSPASDVYDTSEYINKILRLMPNKLVIYGKQDLSVNAQLDILGINYRYYEDFHRRSKRRAA